MACEDVSGCLLSFSHSIFLLLSLLASLINRRARRGSTYKTFFFIELIIAYYVLDAYEVVYYFIPVTDDANDIAYVLG